MSFYPGSGGGAGGGWPPPFFTQPPPGIPPMPFFATDPSQNQGFPPGMQPDYQQQGYNPYVQVPVPGQQPVVSSSQSIPQPQHQMQVSAHQVQVQEHQSISLDRSLEKEHRRSEYKSSPGRYSPPSRDRHSPDRGRRSHRDSDDSHDRYARTKRGTTDEHEYRRHGIEERGRQKDRGRRNRPDDSPTKSKSQQDKPKVDIDALLQDERLRNVLFAGISKATAKLEQSLQDGKGTKEQSDFEPDEVKNQLFPSALSQKPRSILKRKDGSDVGSSKALSSLSALERTLHMLRSKGDVTSESTPSDNKLSTDRKSPPTHGALSKLAAYNDGDDESYRQKSEKLTKEKELSTSSSTQPFWSVPSKLEASKRESDSFDMKEKMFEEWRQSIGKHSDVSSKSSQREMQRNADIAIEYKQSVKKRDIPKIGEMDNQEELDSTVQNILQSIGFNFDLSKRMQELARKKRMQEDEGSSRIRDVSASFMDKGDLLAEELKASLLRSGSDLSSIDSLIKEARASSQGNRHSISEVRSPSSDRRGSSYGREGREMSESASRYERNAREEEMYSRSKEKRTSYDAERWERMSPELSPEKLSSPTRRHFKDRDSPSPRNIYDDRARRTSHTISERLRDDGERNEYFYPDKEYADSPPSVPLLTSFSSRKRSEDLTGGLLKSLRVENFRVMSRPNDNPEDESHLEMRRVILPAKSDNDRGRSPPRTVMRKRSASPMVMPGSKERKISPGYYDDYKRSRSPKDSYQIKRTLDKNNPLIEDSDAYFASDRKKSPPQRRRSPSPRRRSPSPRRRSPSPRRRSTSPRRRERSKSPNRRRSRTRSKSRSPHRRRSPQYQRRSRSPRRRSRSPRRGKSRSPVRRRSPSRRGPLVRSRRRTPPRRSVRSGSRSKEQSKRESTSSKPGTGSKPPLIRKDISKLPEEERKAELKKAVMALGDNEPKAKAEECDEETTSRISTVVDDFKSMVEMDQTQVSKMKTEISLLSAFSRKKALNNLATRKSKLSTLKTDLEKLKKTQNELMRKSQRSGLGNKDPHLKANNLCQMEIEKEIDRLSVTDAYVALGSNLEQNLRSIRSKLEKDTTDSKPKSKTPSKPKESDSTESVAKDDSKWTSVKLQDADLPEIAHDKNEKKKTEKSKEKERSVPAKPRKDIYYEYIDSKNHWCSHCHINLNALDQFFSHLHGKKHLNVVSTVAKPWVHAKDESEGNKKVGKSQTRRTKGSEMLFPVTGFYCTLCAIYCGDFIAADKHLKSDDHYDKYLGFVRDNPDYEKKLLLEKTTKGKVQNVPETEVSKETLSLPASTKKGKKKAKSLRQKKAEEEKEAAGNLDNTEPVDMELDEDERNDDVDVASKVPKMTGKFANSVASILSNLPETGICNNSVEMKSNKEDGVKSLDKFLTIAKEPDELTEKSTPKSKSKKKQSAKIPVIGAKKELDLSEIPIPKAPELTTIPLPPNEGNSVSITATVKTLKEVEDDEKRMMGIDVDAEEEKPLGHVKRPPPLSQKEGQLDKSSDDVMETKEVTKPKKLDNLLSKMKVSTIHKVKPQNIIEPSKLEIEIEQGIKEKLEREKQKIIKAQEKRERKEKKQEEKRMMKMKKKIYSDSSSEEASDSEENEEKEENNSEIQNEVESKSFDAIEIKMEKGSPKTNPCESSPNDVPGSEQFEKQELVTKTTDEGFEMSLVKDELQQIPKENLLKLEAEKGMETPPMVELKVEDTCMDVDTIVGNNEGKMEDNKNIADQVSLNAEVSASVTMELIGLGDIGLQEQTSPMDSDIRSSEFGAKDVLQVETTSVPVDSNEMETIEEVSKLGGSNAQVRATGNEHINAENKDEEMIENEMSGGFASNLEASSGPTVSRDSISKDVSKGNEIKKVTDSEPVMPSSDSVNVSDLEALTTNDKELEQEGFKKMMKTPVVKALQLESDLLTVFESSPETLLEGMPKKNLGPKKSVARRGGRASTRASKKIAQVSPGKKEEADLSMDDFVVLSEVAEEEEEKGSKDKDKTSVHEVEVSDVLVQSTDPEDDIVSKKEDDKKDEIGKSDEIEAVKPVSIGKQARGGKSGTRGKGRGKRVSLKKETLLSETPVTGSTGELRSENSGDLKGRQESTAAEGTNVVDSTETYSTSTPLQAVEDEEGEAVSSPVVSRARRGRSATAAAKTTAKASGRQTRTRGKKKETEIESHLPAEDMNVEDNEINHSGTNKEESVCKSEDVAFLKSELDNENVAGVSEEVTCDPSDLKDRATRSRQGKSVTVLITDVATENIKIQGETDEIKDDLKEEMPSLQLEGSDIKDKPKGRSLRLRQAKKVLTVEDVKVKDEGNDSDATITDDVEESDSLSQAVQIEDMTQSEIDSTSASTYSTEQVSSSQMQKDLPMCGVVSEFMETSDYMEMDKGEEEVPTSTNASEIDTFPAAGLNLGLEDDDSFEFPDSMAGFTVLDVEGQPDDDNDDQDYCEEEEYKEEALS